MAILTIGKGGAECRKSARLGPRGEVSGISRAALPSIGGGARCRASAGVFSQCNDSGAHKNQGAHDSLPN